MLSEFPPSARRGHNVPARAADCVERCPGDGDRSRSTVRKGPVALVLMIAVAVLGAGCGSSSNASNHPTGSANVKAAKAAIASFSTSSKTFPITEPLPGRLPQGTTFVYFDQGGPAGALFGSLLKSAASGLGVQLKTIPAGTTAASSQAAAASALALKPAAVLLLATAPSLFGDTLKQLSDAGIKVISAAGGGETEKYGIDFNYLDVGVEETGGRLMADWVIANEGSDANIAFYGVPEIDWTASMQTSFKNELAKNCGSCQVRFVPVHIADLGSRAAQTVVTDLQSHPATTFAVLGLAGIGAGLPAAMKAASISVPDLGYAPEPGQIQDIKDGGMTAGYASDLATETWAWLDSAARLVLGDKPVVDSSQGITAFLTQKDVNFDPTNGWVAFPNYATEFEKLWHPAS